MDHPDVILRDLKGKGLWRQLTAVECTAEGLAEMPDGVHLANFASNDYLGLAWHPEVMEAFVAGVRDYGAGSGASRLVTGTRGVHLALEEALAALKGAEAALSFSSGYAVSVGLIPSIVGRGDVVVLDKLSHASLIDGAKLSGARIATFRHNDPASLERKLASMRRVLPDAVILVVTESVFSMDGDTAPLKEIAAVKQRHGALLLVDEAHGLGVLGPRGEGLASALGVSGQIEFQMGTLSKAVGLSGGYVACSRAWKDVLVNRSRSLIYSTAPPPAIASAALKSLELITGSEGDARRRHLERLRSVLAPALKMHGELLRVVYPIVIGGNEEALEASVALKRRGFLAPAIRFPTVPEGTARLRVSLSAHQQVSQVEELAKAFVDLSLC